MSPPDDRDEVLGIYAGYDEWSRLDDPLGQVEFLRTTEILERDLPPPPARVADIGGGPGAVRAVAGRPGILGDPP